MERQHWTLLALCAAKGRTLSPVQLQKSLFLLGEMLPDAVGQAFYKFQPYHYGPFAAEIYSDAEQLAREGLVLIAPTPQGWSQYSATSTGTVQGEELKHKPSPEAREYLDKVVPWVQSQSFSELVRVVYQNFPDYRKHSIFED